MQSEIKDEPRIPASPTPSTESHDVSTLDEPVLQTVLRDAKAVGVKFMHVVLPRNSQMLLKDWDLWGPLILCTFLALPFSSKQASKTFMGVTGCVSTFLMTDSMLHNPDSESHNAAARHSGPDFAVVFIIYWLGAAVVTLNSKLLGGTLSFFQSVCILGYCVFPLCVALIVCRIILFAHQTGVLFAVRAIVVLLAFSWSTFASTAFLASVHEPKRKALAVYPVFLFYFIISWMILSHKP